MEFLIGKLTGIGWEFASLGVFGVAVAYILKRIPNELLQEKFGNLMEGLGVATTLGLSKFRYTKRVWNKVIEPWFIDAIENIIVTGIARYIKGMRSD